MRNGSDDDHARNSAFGPGPSAGGPVVGVPQLSDDAFDLGDLVTALRRPVDFGPGVDTAVMDAIRLAPAPLVVVSGASDRSLDRGVGRAPTRARRIGARGLASTTEPFVPVTAAAPLPRAWRWFTRPRAVRVTPIGALAAAGIAVAAVLGLRRDAARREDPRPTGADQATAAARSAAGPTVAAAPVTAPTTAPARDTVFVTRFYIVAPGAKQVALVGDFNDWDHAATQLTPVAVDGAGAHGAASAVWEIRVPLTAGRHSYAFLIDGKQWMADPTRPRAIGDDFGRPSSAVTVGGGEA